MAAAEGSVVKGIVLAGGAGSRLDPITRVASKQLQPVYDKPMVFYPLATLMESGIRQILVISTPRDTPRLERLLGDGSDWGLELTYAVQSEPKGIAEAFLVGEDFISGDAAALILGDNIFYGDLGTERLVSDFETGAVIFGYPVHDPQRYGVVEIDDGGRVLSLEEKPSRPKSNLAVPGFYVYDHRVVEVAKGLSPSARGELEITDVNRFYLDEGSLTAVRLGRGIAWLDSGTHDSLLEAANFIATIEHRQGLKIACLEEIALSHGFMTVGQMDEIVAAMPNSSYRDYVQRVVEEHRSNA
ncbi:MAG: glucose-1-phosphate thymidylyltransferase RfbA [Acidimicrobiia bacterium]